MFKTASRLSSININEVSTVMTILEKKKTISYYYKALHIACNGYYFNEHDVVIRTGTDC